MDIPFYHSPTFKAAHQREQATALIQSQLGVGTALGRFPCLAFVHSTQKKNSLNLSNLMGVPGVVINDLIFRLDKGVIDDLQAGVDHRHSGQL